MITAVSNAASPPNRATGVVPTADFLRKVMSTNPNSTPYALDLHGQNLRELDALETFPKIRSLDVSFNKLADLDGLKPLPDLRELKAYSNRLTDVFSLGDFCPDLQLLHLHDNRLTSIPKSFSKLVHLKELALHRNELSSISNLSNSSALTFLDLSSNQLTAPMPGLSPLISLQTLLLNGNDLSGASLPHPLQDLHNLTELQVSDNMLTGLSGCPKSMSVLLANRNHLSSPDLGWRGGAQCTLKNLTELHLMGNRLTAIPTNLHLVAPLLDLLDVSDNRIPDLSCLVGGVSVAPTTTTTTTTTTAKQPSDSSPLSSLSSLRELYVAGNPCTPRDANGNVSGIAAMEWWYAVALCVTRGEGGGGGVKSVAKKRTEAEANARLRGTAAGCAKDDGDDEGGGDAAVADEEEPGGVEVLDDLLCGTSEVRKQLAVMRREKEVQERRREGSRFETSSGAGKVAGARDGLAVSQQQGSDRSNAATATKARPKSARKRPGMPQQNPHPSSSTAANDGVEGTSGGRNSAPMADNDVKNSGEGSGGGGKGEQQQQQQLYKMPVIRPPLAHANRDVVPMRLEPMDDIEAKFGDIKARLNKCRDLTRPNGMLPTGKGLQTKYEGSRATTSSRSPEIEDDIAVCDSTLTLEELEDTSSKSVGVAPPKTTSKLFLPSSPRPSLADPSGSQLDLEESPQSSQKSRQQKERDDCSAEAKVVVEHDQAAQGESAAAREAAVRKTKKQQQLEQEMDLNTPESRTSSSSRLHTLASSSASQPSATVTASAASKTHSKASAKLQQHLARVGLDEDAAVAAAPLSQRSSSPRQGSSDLEKDGKKNLPLSKSRAASTSSAIQNLLKKADARIKQAQAYSGSKNSHLMPSTSVIPSGGSGSSSNIGRSSSSKAVAGKQRTVGEGSEAIASASTSASTSSRPSLAPPSAAAAVAVNYSMNDAKEFHPEFEQYEGATLDDYDVGFGIYGQDSATPRGRGGAKTPRTNAVDNKDLKFGLGDSRTHGGNFGGDDDDSSSSSEDELAHGKKVAAAPLPASVDQRAAYDKKAQQRFQGGSGASYAGALPVSVDDYGIGDEEMDEDAGMDEGHDDENYDDDDDDDYVNPFTGEKIKVPKSEGKSGDARSKPAAARAGAAPVGGIKSSLAFGKALVSSETSMNASSSDDEYSPPPPSSSVPNVLVKPLSLPSASSSSAAFLAESANGLPMTSPRFDKVAHAGAAAMRKAPTAKDRAGSFKGFRLPTNKGSEAKAAEGGSSN